MYSSSEWSELLLWHFHGDSTVNVVLVIVIVIFIIIIIIIIMNVLFTLVHIWLKRDIW